MKRVTAARAKSIRKPGLYRADTTLYLRVARGGSKQWVQRIMIHGHRHDLGLGPFPLVSLSKAREKAIQNRVAVHEGRNPLAEKRAAQRRAGIPTFRQAAKETYAVLRPRWRSAKVAANWMQQLERHAFKTLGDLPVDRISRKQILAVLTPIWTSKPETARRVRRHIKATLQWCIAHGHADSNAAGEGIDGALPKMPAVKAHFRALPYSQVASALQRVQASGASDAGKLALRFLVLTAARPGEVRGALWTEIDVERRLWHIPGHRMKNGQEHRVPLSDAAIAVLEQARALDNGSGLVFPSPVKQGNRISNVTLTKILRTTGLAKQATVHGFRSTFRDWCADTGKPRELAEAALSHSVGGVEGAYFRSDLFERRRRLMQRWADFATDRDARDATVVSLRG